LVYQEGYKYAKSNLQKSRIQTINMKHINTRQNKQSLSKTKLNNMSYKVQTMLTAKSLFIIQIIDSQGSQHKNVMNVKKKFILTMTKIVFLTNASVANFASSATK